MASPGWLSIALEMAIHRSNIQPKAIAMKLGVNPTTVHFWRTSRSRPSDALVPRLAEILGIPIKELTDDPRGLFGEGI